MVKKNNYFDKIKRTKFSKISQKEQLRQLQYFQDWCEEMIFRKAKGDEKYGNYMMEVDDKTSFQELKEEMIDVCNHLIMLTYKLNRVFVKEKKK